MKNIKLGIFGFGAVGQGLYDDLTQSIGFKAEIKKIAVKNANKKRKLPAEMFTTDKSVILNDPQINIIAELTDDAEAAYPIVVEALKKGKSVVTANKKLVAEHLPELVELQKQTGSSLLYEASACGAIPIIRNLEEYYDNELLLSVSGIFNGSSNYILSKVFNEGADYDVALKEAQDLGFAETDPTLDVGGYDSKYKLVIIAAHSYGIFVPPDEVLNLGIQNLSDSDVRFAREKGYKIRLVATARKVDEKVAVLFVLPQFVNKHNYLYNVEYEFNAVIAEAAFLDRQFFVGKGSGSHPTGSAVLADISANRFDYKYEYKKLNQNLGNRYSKDVEMEVYFRYPDEKTLKKLNFIIITEHFTSERYNYVIGIVKLKTLFENRALFDQPDVFLVSTGKFHSYRY